MRNARAKRLRIGHGAWGWGSGWVYLRLELMFAAALCVTLGAIAAPQLLAAVDDVRAAGAVRYLSTRLQQARMEAVGRSADVGLQFVQTSDGYAYAVYVDG